jgi:hypothetical protein
MDAWNVFAKEHGLPTVIKMVPRRRRHLRARLADELFAERWPESLQKAGESSFLMGQSRSKWHIIFDWWIKNDVNYLKILEGVYDDKDFEPEEHRSTNAMDVLNRRP